MDTLLEHLHNCAEPRVSADVRCRRQTRLVGGAYPRLLAFRFQRLDLVRYEMAGTSCVAAWNTVMSASHAAASAPASSGPTPRRRRSPLRPASARSSPRVS